MFNNRVWRINNDVVDLQHISEPIHETLNGDLKPCRFFERNRTGSHGAVLLFFIALCEQTADGDRKGSHKDRSPNLMRLPTENDHLAHVVKPLKGQCSNQTAWAHKQRSEAGVLRCAGVNPERLQTLRD